MMDYIEISDRLKKRLQELETYKWMSQHGLGYPSLDETVYLFNEDEPNLGEGKKFIIGKHDLMLILDCGEKKSLKVLHLLQQCGMGFKLGKEYYTTPEQLNKFFNEQMGNIIYL